MFLNTAYFIGFEMCTSQPVAPGLHSITKNRVQTKQEFALINAKSATNLLAIQGHSTGHSSQGKAKWRTSMEIRIASFNVYELLENVVTTIINFHIIIVVYVNY